MSELKLSAHGESVKQVIKALGVGHIEAVLSKKDVLLALKPNELERLTAIMKVTRAAGNGCCTGG